MVEVRVETEPVDEERLGPVDIGDGDRHQSQLEIHQEPPFVAEERRPS
jgi:hypothetical protein